MIITLLLIASIVANLAFFGCWRTEVRRHHKSRRALAFWREAAQNAGVTGQILSLQNDGQAPRIDQAELDMIRVREELRRQADVRRYTPGRTVVRTRGVARPGDAA